MCTGRGQVLIFYRREVLATFGSLDRSLVEATVHNHRCAFESGERAERPVETAAATSYSRVVVTALHRLNFQGTLLL